MDSTTELERLLVFLLILRAIHPRVIEIPRISISLRLELLYGCTKWADSLMIFV
jgi:hypothetical protein